MRYPIWEHAVHMCFTFLLIVGFFLTKVPAISDVLSKKKVAYNILIRTPFHDVCSEGNWRHWWWKYSAAMKHACTWGKKRIKTRTGGADPKHISGLINRVEGVRGGCTALHGAGGSRMLCEYTGPPPRNTNVTFARGLQPNLIYIPAACESDPSDFHRRIHITYICMLTQTNREPTSHIYLASPRRRRRILYEPSREREEREMDKIFHFFFFDYLVGWGTAGEIGWRR